MTSKSLQIAFALSLVLVVPVATTAQEDSSSADETSAESEEAQADSEGEEGGGAESETGDADSAEADSNAEEGSESGNDSEDGGEASGESQSSEKSDEGAEGSDEGGEEGKKGKKTGKKEGEETPETGPGGTEMRQDYPGTDESKEKQMDTDRIEGLQFKEGEKPSEAYDLEIKELETKIDNLKEEVFESKSRVVLLKETVLGGNLSGSRGTIVHHNNLGARFRLTRAMYSLDGSRVFNKTTKTSEDIDLNKEKFQVYDGSITSGNHNVSILLEYEGSGFGLFNYMQDYNFRITSSCQFKAKEGKAVVLRVRTKKQGGAFSGIEKKPGIECQIETRELSEQRAKAASKEEGAGDGDSGEGESGQGGDGEQNDEGGG